MHTHNRNRVLISTSFYMFRCLLRHLRGELYRLLKTRVTLFDYRSLNVLYMGLQRYLQLLKKQYLVQRKT